MSNFNELTTKKARTAYIREKMESDQRWAGRGLVRIWENQNEDEKSGANVTASNGIGFTTADAYILTSFADQYNANGTLSQTQWIYVHKLMPKYARQLENSIT